MKVFKYSIINILSLFILTIGFVGCEEYLDKAPEANITDDDVYKKFSTYQGFVEDMYQCVVDIANRDVHGMGNWNWGDDLVGVAEKRMWYIFVKQ